MQNLRGSNNLTTYYNENLAWTEFHFVSGTTITVTNLQDKNMNRKTDLTLLFHDNFQ